ncbi:hypothetical protein [Streptomyces sp. 150FB]|uniref:hypothetical protein n=1 Tax=Streptomyces sp. 150FB TaxID=1576605 RepID=UPI001F36DB17|nr:hypothetical protein [Streptomyces sp. 150FB]
MDDPGRRREVYDAGGHIGGDLSEAVPRGCSRHDADGLQPPCQGDLKGEVDGLHDPDVVGSHVLVAEEEFLGDVRPRVTTV